MLILVSAVLVLAYADWSADRVTHVHGHLVGSQSTQLAKELGAPDDVEIVTPFTWETATGQITTRLDAYIVWRYYPRPDICHCLPLRVLIDDHINIISRFKGPLD